MTVQALSGMLLSLTSLRRAQAARPFLSPSLWLRFAVEDPVCLGVRHPWAGRALLGLDGAELDRLAEGVDGPGHNFGDETPAVPGDLGGSPEDPAVDLTLGAPHFHVGLFGKLSVFTGYQYVLKQPGRADAEVGLATVAEPHVTDLGKDRTEILQAVKCRATLVQLRSGSAPRSLSSLHCMTIFWTFQISVPSRLSVEHLYPLVHLIPLDQTSLAKARTGATWIATSGSNLAPNTAHLMVLCTPPALRLAHRRAGRL